MNFDGLPKYGVFTPYTLNLHHTVTREHPAAFLKRAAILFEHFVFVPEGLGTLMDPGSPLGETWWLDALFDGSDGSELKDYRSLFRHSGEFWTNEEENWRAIQEDRANDLWHGEGSAEFLKWVSQQVEKDVATGAILDDASDRLEQHKMYLGNLSHDYKILAAISESSPDFAGLFTPAHEEAALATFQVKPANADAVLKTISNVSMIDLGSLTWKQVFLLRKSGFLQDFRSKISEWVNAYVATPVSHDFQASLSQMMTVALLELVGETTPNLPASILSAVVSTLPGLGALSAAKTLIDIKSERDRQDRYGWLYFIQKARVAVRVSGDRADE